MNYFQNPRIYVGVYISQGVALYMRTFRTPKPNLGLLFHALIIIDCFYSFGLIDLFLELINLLQVIQSQNIVLI